MQKRTLGNSNLEVSALGLGCMRMSYGDNPIDKQEMISFLHAAVDRGITFFDPGDSIGYVGCALTSGHGFVER